MNLFVRIRDFFCDLLGNQAKEEVAVINLIPDDPEEIPDLKVFKINPMSHVSKTKLETSKAKPKPAVSKAKLKASIPEANPKRRFPVTDPAQRITPTIRFKSQPHPFKKGHWIVVDSNGKTVYVSEDRVAAQVAAKDLNTDRLTYDVKLKTIGQRPPFDLARYEENNGDWRTD